MTIAIIINAKLPIIIILIHPFIGMKDNAATANTERTDVHSIGTSTRLV